MGIIERLLQGSTDMHIHAGPDARVGRSVDAWQAAREAGAAGMRAIVLKSHEYPTAPLAKMLNSQGPGTAVVGSICLNHEVGGLNPAALEASAAMGAKVVWMPTTSAYSARRKSRTGLAQISLLDNCGKLVPEVQPILEIIRRNHLVLATGHISKLETLALVEEAHHLQIDKIIITHPLTTEVGAGFTLEDQVRLAQSGAFVEHTLNNLSPLRGRLDPAEMVAAITAAGADHCLLTTDFGQLFNPRPVEGMRVMIAIMLESGCNEKQVEAMTKINPAKLLDLT